MLDKRLHIKISKEQYQWIKERFSEKGMSMGEIIRDLIVESMNATITFKPNSKLRYRD